MALKSISVRVKDLKCSDTSSFFGTDNVYFISTLRYSKMPSVVSTIPAKRIKDPRLRSDVATNVDDDEKPHNFASAAFSDSWSTERPEQPQDDPEKEAITGSIYFMNQLGTNDLRYPTRNKIPVGRVSGWGSIIGAILGLIGMAGTGGNIWVGFGTWLGVSALVWGVANLLSYLIDEEIQDEFLFAITPTIKVHGPDGTEPVGGSPFQRSDVTDDIEMTLGKRTIEFDGISTHIKYQVSLDVIRSTTNYG